MQNRFQFALTQFLKTVCSWGRVVMLLDDLQWADAESLHLLQQLISSSSSNTTNNGTNTNNTTKTSWPLTIVGCYRHNEVASNEAHILSKWIRDVQAEHHDPNTVVQIHVSPMNETILTHMLSDVLNMPITAPSTTDGEETDNHDEYTKNEERLRELATIVCQKTAGNPFFLPRNILKYYPTRKPWPTIPERDDGYGISMIFVIMLPPHPMSLK